MVARGGATLHGACPLETRVGGFAVQLVEPMLGHDAYTAFSGGIRNGVKPSEVWVQEGTEVDGCRLMVGPSLACTTPCRSGQVCAGDNQCIDEPLLQSVGEVTITGVGPSPIVLTSTPTGYTGSLTAPYPPAAAGANVTLRASGAAIPAFTLAGRAIEPIDFPGTGLTARAGEDFSFTWTAPAPADTGTATADARIFARLEIGHHGGVAARVECDLADTGTGQIPGALVAALVDKGIHGFPELLLTRRTMDSATVGPGCVDFAVASPAARGITVCTASGGCPQSCNPLEGINCPDGATCGNDLTCH
jgi:hypothetical protein